MIAYKFKRRAKLFLTLNKISFEKIWFATRGSVMNCVHFIYQSNTELRKSLVKFDPFRRRRANQETKTIRNLEA